MNNNDLIKKVNITAGELLTKNGFIAPVNLLMELQYLTKKDYEEWRKGNIPYLERACQINLKKLSFIMKALRTYAKNRKLKPSWTAYMSWGKKNKRKLQFSKSGKHEIELAYSTHFIVPKGLC